MKIDKPLKDVVFYHLDRTVRISKQKSQVMFDEQGFDVTVEQWVVLKKINDQEGASQAEIGAALLKDAPTVTRIIDLLVKKGYVAREAHPNDRRKYQIVLTEPGKQLVVVMTEHVKDWRKRGLAGLSDSEIRELKRILTRVYENIESM